MSRGSPHDNEPAERSRSGELMGVGVGKNWGDGGRKGSSDERGVAIIVRRPAENECDNPPPPSTDRPIRWGDRVCFVVVVPNLRKPPHRLSL